jgi:hypothetical protein
VKTKKILIVAGVLLLACVITVRVLHKAAQSPTRVILVTNPATNIPVRLAHNEPAHEPLQKKAIELTPEEKVKFLTNFEIRYKPAISKWLAAYGNHVPFSSDEITADGLFARIGTSDAFREYVFVIDGITLAVRDRNGIAAVDYLNNPKRTKQLSSLPQRAQAPTVDLPVQRNEVMSMVLADSGTQYPPDQIRMIPSGLSGAMDGGAVVHIGGDPHNGGSWKFDMVFASDGKLAYYRKGL